MASIQNFIEKVFPRRTASNISLNLQLFKDTIRNGYLILDARSQVLDFNPAMKNLLGEQVKIEAGSRLADILPDLHGSLNPLGGQNHLELHPIQFESQDFAYEVMIYPIGNGTGNSSGRILIFRAITDRDHLEDTLRKKNMDLSRSNAFFSGLSNLTLSLQSAQDTSIIMETLGNELRRLGLKCFVALYPQDSRELEVHYFSERMETIRIIEKIIGTPILGFRLNREHFSSLYQVLETRQIHYQPDEESGLPVFLGNLPGWIMDPLIKASAVSRQEASMVVPLIAAEKAVGLMGVWGENLLETDIAPFQVFGSQVGWAIEKAVLQEEDLRRVEELSHSNAMVTALSRVSSLLETTPDNDSAFVKMGEELSKIDLSCAIVMLDRINEVATIRYVSYQPEILKKIEKITGFTLPGFQIPKKYWPSEKATQEGIPVWHENPEGVFNQLFSNLPGGVVKRAYQLVKGVQTGPLCFLPLRARGEVIGVMPIWGPGLSSRDNLTLSLFGDQVAAILRRNDSYKNEVQKSGEIARSNSMIMALSGVASQLDSTTDLNQVLETLGKELKKVHLSCMVGTIDAAKQMLTVEYLTIGHDIQQVAQKFGFSWPEEMKIPRRLWPTDKAVTEKAPYWDPNPIGKAHQMFPFIPKEVFHSSMRFVGLDLTEPVCYLPMLNEEDVIGILAVWGKELKSEDIPALSIFANQVATAIRNTWLYTKAQKEIVERTQAEARIREALTEKEVLIKEVHHRVKNNLQVISSLLNLQAAEISDPDTLNVLRESQNRVRTMALIHEKLYQSSDLARIDFSTYLQSLVYSLAQSYRVRADRVSVEVHADKILLDLDTAIPCGLIVNELVSNSIKYAFPGDRSGKIQVSCSLRSDKDYSLMVCDDGIGLPDGFDYTKSTSLGLKLVNSLIHQIDGELMVNNLHGTRFEIHFSKPETA
jgi:two-component sensor histidine kinase